MSHDNARASRPCVSSRTDRRRQTRQVALLRVALLHVGDESDISVVKNISPNGLSARVYRRLTPGEQVELEFRSGELLAGSVVWEDEWDVGIVFPRPIDVAAVLASRQIAEKGKRRALPRISVQCSAQLSTGLRTTDVVLQDISQGGANLESNAELPDFKNVCLLLPDLPPVAGVVRWVSGTKIGLSFNENIAFESLARWIQARREGLGWSAREHDRGPAVDILA